MRSRLPARAGVVVLLAISSVAALPVAAIPVDIADFESDFRTTGAPIKGWSYLWNATDRLGRNVDLNYQPLTLQNGQYVGPSGTPIFGQGSPNPLAYIVRPPFPGTFPQTFVRPGPGTLENPGGFERAAIIAYTFRAQDFSAAGITTSQATAYITYYDFAVSAFAVPDGMSARVYHDSDPNPLPGLDFSLEANPPFPFPPDFRFQETLDSRDIPLGTYSVGDTVYIALGANTLSGNDEMRLDFTLALEPVPEPGAIALLVPAGLIAMSGRRRVCSSRR